MELPIICLLLGVLSLQHTFVTGKRDKVLLTEIKTLTLYNGQMANARRTSPIPQLKCVGGTAGCSSFTPQVVQCTNKGTDGYDVQWECKTDMDNDFRFGRVEVSCEGYEYPDDPYVLRGSCGLEYTLDLTKQGHKSQHKQGHQHNYYGGSQQGSHSYYDKVRRKGSSMLGDLVMLAIVGVIIYAIYKTCIAPSTQGYTGDDAPGGFRAGPRSGPPPPGFRDEYMPPGGGCSSTYGSTYTSNGGYTGTHNTGTGGGGFWTGAATGGLLGYLMGSRTNTYGNHYSPPGYSTGWGSGWGSSWGSGGGGGFTTSSGSSDSSSGTRTASGFGGTRRR